MFRRIPLILLIVTMVCAAQIAYPADASAGSPAVFHLKNGKSVQGTVTFAGNASYVVQGKDGAVTCVFKSDVESYENISTPPPAPTAAAPVAASAANDEKSANVKKAQQLYDQALAYSKQNSFNKAIPLFDKAIDLRPEPMLYNDRGVAYMLQGNLSAAMGDFMFALRLDPALPQAYNNMGLVYAKYRGDFVRGLESFSKAIERDPKYVDAYMSRGMAYIQMGKTGEALADYSKAIELDPNRKDIYFNRAAAYAEKGDFDKAWEDYHTAEKAGVPMDPGFVEQLKKASGRSA